MASYIEQLPVELIGLVISCLDSVDYGSLRLASKHIHSTTLDDFLRTFFAEFTTLLTPAALQRTVDVSSHELLAGSVRVLHITHRRMRVLHQFDSQEHQRNQSAAEVVERISQNLRPESVIGPLAYALRRCYNINSICFYLEGCAKPNWLMNRRENIDFQSNCFKLILEAVVESGVQLQEFSTMGQDDTQCATIPYFAFDFSIPFLHSLDTAFSNLCSLTIAINEGTIENPRVPGWANAISRFISTASSLESLTLIIEMWGPVPGCGVKIFHSLSQIPVLAQLRAVRINGGSFEEQDMATFALRHADSLRRIRLESNQMMSGTWKSLLATLRKSKSLEHVHLEDPKGGGEDTSIGPLY
ncbi:hypothetical protein K504DRAFT_128717 [Pleomassaria siparia CBS 279.74]|uniref:F-box domain-containing protein n=1 Tax=Pleomassaria siparia CBS 279.74 TaxID=1314801 RepID=A0A6G1KKH7_9PLEO|nr:hypothetical protein K504DRAFT_128717 [Pleomassaria siparia CBS 279.74]